MVFPQLATYILRMTDSRFKIAVTGAGSGIGLATAQLLAKKGALLSICDVNEEALEEALTSLEGNGHMGTLVNVSDATQVDKWVETTVARLGLLSGAANVAGVMRLGTMTDLSDQDWDHVMNVNGRGVFYAMRAQLANMKDGGSIVRGSSLGLE